MSQKIFQAACAVLWGPAYRSPGAREQGIGLRSMMRYDAGEREVPAALLDRLYGMLIKRHGEVGKLIGRLGDLRDARKEAA